MANTYHQIYLQTIFAVKYRASMIDEKWSNQLYGVIGNLINELGCKTYIVNGVEDHVHCLLSLRPVVSVSKLMQHAKAKSSKYINDNKLITERFEWQDVGSQHRPKTFFIPILKIYSVYFGIKTLSLKNGDRYFVRRIYVAGIYNYANAQTSSLREVGTKTKETY